MNKGKQFWHNMWRDGHIPFHLAEVNPDLIQYWSKMSLHSKATVLVPLCGKSLDMVWLCNQGYRVIGIELSDIAVTQLAEEHKLCFEKEKIGNAFRYFMDSMEIWVADLFELPQSVIPPVDAVYDRAALIALPQNLRSTYVNKCLDWLVSGGKIFLKSKVYNQNDMQGPPFSVPDHEIFELYKQCGEFNKLVEVTRPCHRDHPLHDRGLKEVTDVLWMITKK